MQLNSNLLDKYGIFLSISEFVQANYFLRA
jgi:hypothetical protein